LHYTRQKRIDMAKTALIVVDVQRDFCEGGALAAAETRSLMEPLREYIDAARRNGATIVYTRDWHPAKHTSFKENGGPWPVHCVADTPGAELHPPLRAIEGDIVIHKGVGLDGQGYSGFDSTELAESLRKREIKRVLVTGIATEYCVRATALDALKEGFETLVVDDLVRSVQPSETEKVLDELKAAGVEITTASREV
jgi:nicotinamidase/pyrazinamidase